MSLYDKLQIFARKENIIAGVGTAEPFYELKEQLIGKTIPFVDYSIDERTEPKLTMPNVKSLVAIGLSYNVVYSKINDGRIRGNISSGAVGRDYHLVVTEKLERLKKEVLPYNEVKIFTDTGPLSDRAVAERCCLGKRGKNGSIINSKIGGMFFIGYMLTDIDYEFWQAENQDYIDCSDCEKCISSCPNSAIKAGICDYNKCISYLTQKKGVLTDCEYEQIGMQIYGCDICQRVCPYNSSFTHSESEYANPDLEKLLNMTNKEFKEVYGSTAAGWRGKRTLQRNALAVLGNMKCKSALPLIEKYTKSEYEDIRSAAIYAANKIKES